MRYIAGDPQCYRPHQNLTDAWRKINYGHKHSALHCDKQGRDGLSADAWYAFTLPGTERTYSMIPTTPPATQYVQYDRQTCGTYTVAWIEDKMPGVGEAVKEVTFYFAWQSNPKFGSMSGKVVACPGPEGEVKYLYYLRPSAVPGCHVAFCAL